MKRKHVKQTGSMRSPLRPPLGCKTWLVILMRVPPSDLDKNYREELDKRSKLSGADFDKEYMERMVKDHKEAVLFLKKWMASFSSGRHPMSFFTAFHDVQPSPVSTQGHNLSIRLINALQREETSR
jgi:hypothetical protein